MLRPAHVVTLARVALLAGSLTITALTLGPFNGAERIFGLDDEGAHALAFGGLLAIAFLAFPRSRRSDLTLAALALGAAIEVAQIFDQRTASLADWMADAAGILAVYGASMIETVRKTTREQADLTFSQIAAMDRRRSRGRVVAFEPGTGAAGAPSFAERAARRFPAR